MRYPTRGYQVADLTRVRLTPWWISCNWACRPRSYQNVFWTQADALFFGSVPVDEVAAEIAHQMDLQIERALRIQRRR